MTAPTRFRGATATVPGRLTVPVHVPADLLDEAARIAERLGEDRAVVLGDLVAAALPAALAEAADDLVGRAARRRLDDFPPDMATPPALAEGVTSSTGSPQAVAPSLAAGDPDQGTHGGPPT